MRRRTILILLSAVVMLAGCGSVGDGRIRIHDRSAAAADLGIELTSGVGRSWSRVSTTAGNGCSAVGVPRTIAIGPANRDGAVGEYVPLMSSESVANPADAEIWIDVAEDGRVTWGEGEPDWALVPGADCRSAP